MEVFDPTGLAGGLDPTAAGYLEFLRVPAMSVGVYRIPAGGTDPQEPHREDEVYVVLGGRATLWVGGEERSLDPGAVAFVAAGVPHRFQDVREDLIVLVVFAPAETDA